MFGLIEELFETMDHPSALAALQQQVDKGDLDAMLFLGVYNMYIAERCQPEKALSYLDMAYERYGETYGLLIRALEEESHEPVDVDSHTFAWVITTLLDQISNASMRVIKHLVWLAKIYRVCFDAKPLLQRLNFIIRQVNREELFEARLLYVELLSLSQLNTFSQEKALRYWTTMLEHYPVAATARRALYMHFRLRGELLSDAQVEAFIDREESNNRDIALYKGYWELCRGDLLQAYRSFEKGYARGEYRCDVALAYCLWHGYGTMRNPDRAKALCSAVAAHDSEAALMLDRFSLQEGDSRYSVAMEELVYQGLELNNERALTELILQRHHYWATMGLGKLSLDQAVAHGLDRGVPLAAFYPYRVGGEYHTESCFTRKGSDWLFFSEQRGSHPLTDYQLGVYHCGMQEYEESARYFMRVVRNPNVSLCFRKRVAEELVARFANLAGGVYFQQVLDWWDYLDPVGLQVEHLALQIYKRMIAMDSEDPEYLDQLDELKCLSASDQSELGFVYFLIGYLHTLPGVGYDPDAAHENLCRSSELDCFLATEKLFYDSLYQQCDWVRVEDRDWLEERLDHCSSPHRLDWTIGEMAGYGFLSLL